MTVALDLTNGNTETFTTENYVISRTKDFHPMICRVTVFDNGRRIARRKRLFSWWYKKFTFNSFKVQEKLKELNGG